MLHISSPKRKTTMFPILTSGVVLILLLQTTTSATEESFCGNKCYGQGVVTSRSCHCDLACGRVYHDCCSDSKYLQISSNSTKENQVVLVCKRKAIVVASCLEEWKGPDFIINSCKHSSALEVDPVGSAPVTSHDTGITYGNFYCAICNGDARNTIMWNIKMSCPLLNPNLPVNKDEVFKYIFYNNPTNEWGYVMRDEFTKKSSFHGCALASEIPKPHQDKIRSCDLKEVNVCHPSWKSDVIKAMCNGYSDPVYSNGTRFKNFYCAICNRVDLSEMTCGEAIGPRNNGLPESDSDSNKLSFSLLLDINFSEGNSVGQRLALLNCRKGEIFDPFARRCRNIVCGIPGYILENGMCVPDLTPLAEL